MRFLKLLTVVLVALPVPAAENDSKAIFAKHWQIAKEFTLAVAEAMPAEDYEFKIHSSKVPQRLPSSRCIENAPALGRPAFPEIVCAGSFPIQH
jgi:hypothetical protein